MVFAQKSVGKIKEKILEPSAGFEPRTSESGDASRIIVDNFYSMILIFFFFSKEFS